MEREAEETALPVRVHGHAGRRGDVEHDRRIVGRLVRREAADLSVLRCDEPTRLVTRYLGHDGDLGDLDIVEDALEHDRRGRRRTRWRLAGRIHRSCIEAEWGSDWR